MATNPKFHFAKSFGILTIAVVFCLAIPFTAMQFSSEVNWQLIDFVVAAILLFAAGTAYLILSHFFNRKSSRIIIATTIVFAVLLIWIELAVGIFH